MSVTQLESRKGQAPILPRHYNRRMARYIWIALRDQKLNSMRGQQRFSDEIYTTLVSAPTEKLPKYADGTRYQIPDSGLSYKTIDNFLNKASSIFNISDEGGASDIRISNNTLSYLHAYLMVAHPDRVEKWRFEDAKHIENRVISGIDDNFDRFNPSSSLPRSLLVYAVNKMQPMRSSVAAHRMALQVESEPDAPEPITLENTELLGAIMFFPIKGGIEDFCVHLPPDQWNFLRFNYTKSIEREIGEFSSHLHLYRGRAIGINLQNLVVDSEFSIPRNQPTVLAKTNRGVHQDSKLVGFRMNEMRWMPLNEADGDSGLLDVMTNFGNHYGVKGTDMSLEHSRLDIEPSEMALLILPDMAIDANEFMDLCYFIK